MKLTDTARVAPPVTGYPVLLDLEKAAKICLATPQQ